MSRALTTCRTMCISHDRIGIFTNMPEAFDDPFGTKRPGAFMAQNVCERPECLRRAEREVLEFTGERGVLRRDRPAS